MKVTNYTGSKITIEFDLLDFDDIKEFFLENLETVSNTDKYQYDAIQKFNSIEVNEINNTYINDLRLKRINEAFDENKKMLNNKVN